MWLEAVLSLEDLRHGVSQLAPVTISLGSDGAGLYIGTPTKVSLIAGEGLHIICPATLAWPVLGIKVPVVISEVSFIMTPRIEQTAGGDLLVFEPRIASADFAMLPGMVDRRLTDLINKELGLRRLDLAWNFSQTLQFSFELPAALTPRRTMSFQAHGAMVRITAEAVVLAVSMKGVVAEVVVPEPSGDTPLQA